MGVKGKSILLIEDDAKIRALVRIYLEKEGYDVWEAGTGEEGKQLFALYDPCFVILDLMLPKLSGEEVCRWIRQDVKSDVPLIMVTAKVHDEEKIQGLQMGADDYVTKPFSPRELIARIETVLRRTAHRCSKISYRGLTLKPLRGEAKINGSTLPLTAHEFRLLQFLMQHPNQILTREQLLEELYPNQERIVTERTIDVHIGKLREKISKEAPEHDFIDTVRGMGYRFVAF